MINIQFFTTLGCHLCEDAELLLSIMVNKGVIKVESIDIIDSDDLMQLYGIRIPVIKKLDTAEELGWPFDIHSLSQFLDN
ncbi:MAG: hypothetical protein ACI9N9_001249 [Enterobacterales bacterium]|jgi:hypothetical protein